MNYNNCCCFRQFMSKIFKVVFILGGPGSGKGTQSKLIQSAFKFKHLSAGQLLREEQKRIGSQFGHIIQKIILEGKIVPSQITVKLLHNAMKASQNSYQNYLIDGFPRNLQNLNSWKKAAQKFAENPFVLHFKCSQQEMLKRLLKRGQESNRSDDNVQVIRKRFLTYKTQTKQVLDQFERQGKVHHINGDQTAEKIFQNLKPIFQNLIKMQV